MLVSRKMLSEVPLCSSLHWAKSLRVTTPGPPARKNSGYQGGMVPCSTDTPKYRSATTMAKTAFWAGTPRN